MFILPFMVIVRFAKQQVLLVLMAILKLTSILKPIKTTIIIMVGKFIAKLIILIPLKPIIKVV